MSYQSLGLGAAADDGTGDSLRVGGDKINDNFLEIYTALGSGTALSSGISATASVVTLTAPVIATSISHADSVKAYYGTGNDLEIYHDGSNSYVSDQGTGLLVMLSNNFRVNNAANSEVMFNAVEDGAVSIYYDNTVHLATDAAGVNITGTLDLSSHLDMPDSAYIKLGTGDDFLIYHDGSNSVISDAGTGSLILMGSTIALSGGADGAETMANFADNGAVTLYYDNAVKFATDTAGVDITGQLDLSSHLDMPDDAYIKLGADDDFKLYHDGTNSYIDNVTGGVFLRTNSTENSIVALANAAVTLYHDASAKLATSAAGISVTGTVTATPTAILLIKNSSGSTLKTINGIAAT